MLECGTQKSTRKVLFPPIVKTNQQKYRQIFILYQESRDIEEHVPQK